MFVQQQAYIQKSRTKLSISHSHSVGKSSKQLLSPEEDSIVRPSRVVIVSVSRVSGLSRSRASTEKYCKICQSRDELLLEGTITTSSRPLVRPTAATSATFKNI